MSARDSISFCLSSVTRNRFLQRASGLFGGDDWLLNTYTAVDDQYRRSEAYSRTMTLLREGTNAPLYQRDPMACWYAMGEGTVALATEQDATVLYINWTISDPLWNTVRVPGQCLTFINGGLPVHGVLAAGTSNAQAIVQMSQPLSSPWQATEVVPYMIRPRPPNYTLLGPIHRQSQSSNRIILQAPPDAIRTPSLIYLGGRSDHPLYTCEMHDPDVARDNIFVVVDVQPVTGATTECRSVSVTLTLENWAQISDHCAVGTVRFDPPVAVTGFTYRWPYPVDQSGESWLLIPQSADGPPVDPPTKVYFVKFVIKPGQTTLPPLEDGDRVLRLDANGAPLHVAEWEATTQSFGSLFSIPPHTLVVLDGDGSAAWLQDVPFQLVARRSHPLSRTIVSVDCTAVSPNRLVSAAVVLLTRSSNDFYGPMINACTTNVLHPASWTYPVSMADGTDRLKLDGLTTALIGSKIFFFVEKSSSHASQTHRVSPAVPFATAQQAGTAGG